MDIRKFIDMIKDLESKNIQMGADGLMEAIKLNGINSSSKLNESSLNRIYSHIMEHDCAVITAFRKELINCFSNETSEELKLRDNKSRNKGLKAALLYLKYALTKVEGSYIENYLADNQKEVLEDSYFVVNLKDDPKFIENIVKLGEIFCQDSVMIMEKGGQNNYLVGTNFHTFPGYGETRELGHFKPAIEAEFMTKVGGRPFSLESFDMLQNNTKYLVKEYAKPILNLL
jgi:hypothetical protein